MEVNHPGIRTKKRPTMADMPKSAVKEALVSAKKTRDKVRSKIKKGSLSKVPAEIDAVI